MVRRIILFTIAAILLFCRCTHGELSSRDAFLKADADRIEAPAEFDGESWNTGLTIRSNCSWYAHLNDRNNPVDVSVNAKVPWGSLDIQDHGNLTGVTDEVRLTVSFFRNRSTSPIEGCLDIYASGGKILSIPIVQEGAVYRLDAATDTDEASCLPGSVVINVQSNTEWTVKIGDESTAEVSLDRDNGIDDGQIVVSFAENLDAGKTKTAEIIISADGCPDKVVRIVQAKAVPYFRCTQGDTVNIPRGVTSYSLQFQTNTDWAAEIKDSTGMRTVVLSKTSGVLSQDIQMLDVSFENTGDDPMAFGTIKLEFILIGTGISSEVTLCQVSPMVMVFDTYPDAPFGMKDVYTDQAYEIKIPTSRNPEGYTFSMYNCRWRNDRLTSGLQIKQYGQFSLPAIEGKTLREVKAWFRFHNSFKSLRLRVTDNPSDNLNFHSGMLNYYQITADWVHSFILGERTDPEILPGGRILVEPEAGKSYSLYCDVNTNNLITRLELYYE